MLSQFCSSWSHKVPNISSKHYAPSKALLIQYFVKLNYVTVADLAYLGLNYKNRHLQAFCWPYLKFTVFHNLWLLQGHKPCEFHGCTVVTLFRNYCQVLHTLFFSSFILFLFLHRYHWNSSICWALSWLVSMKAHAVVGRALQRWLNLKYVMLRSRVSDY